MHNGSNQERDLIFPLKFWLGCFIPEGGNSFPLNVCTVIGYLIISISKTVQLKNKYIKPFVKLFEKVSFIHE